ncbi:Na(+)/H(+) antiporter subunit D [Pseudohaliea rubra]|uniref:NADH-ubiquinone oxidoreductase chain L n=1 Tax=Pseudohaliea rubra DSM 19751 TaxID=1265313 RepID=A0A095XV21_9GAMM|nr:Na(+)/H(+) antiporter subunit D [Pseudohaliea rubra]KGE03536.1 NADH-ubiquinone oxidoreductase chain L [Pseudohaliea rubra DSM 19751]
MNSVAPFLIFYAGGLLMALLPDAQRRLLALAIPLIGAWNLYGLEAGASATLTLFDHTLVLVQLDRLSELFGYLFHLAAFIGFIYAFTLRDRMQQVAAMLYAGSALGAVFAGDLLTLFVFWELLALTSVFLVLARRTARAFGAAMRYLVIQIGSGVLLLAGALLVIAETGDVTFTAMTLEGLGPWLIFLAIGIKCCFPGLHNWLTDAYPESTPAGTVFLSAFTTKVAVYALARAFPGTELLVYIGATMAMFPIFFAVIENDLRRVLAYSLINQVGFMVVGIGIGTELAINGAVAHAFNDVIFKGLLFMTMGAVLLRTGRMNGSDLGGLYKSMPWTTGFCIVGAASISAFPLFSGFVSKSMVMVAALEAHHEIVWLALLFASAGVFHHAGIKIPYFAFYAHDSGLRCREAPRSMLVAMGLAAALCLFIGSYPWLLYDRLPFPVNYEPYTAAHILTQSQLLFFSALAFVWLNLKGLYPPELPSTNLDVEWSYRRLLPAAAGAVRRVAGSGFGALGEGGQRLVTGGVNGAEGLLLRVGLLGRVWSTRTIALWVLLLLVVYVFLEYL